jgi:predicted transcriptional regulator
MKICPVAIAVGCRKCPVFSACPAKGLIGDFKAEVKEAAKAVKEAVKPK